MQALLFDIGGVLVRTDDLAPRRKWDQRFGLPDWGVAKIVFENTAAAAATVGQATDDEVWAEVARQLDLTASDVSTLRADFWAGDRVDADLLALIESFRPRYKTGIISNAWPGYAQWIRPQIGAEKFDVVLFSSEHRTAKPAPEIYQYALRQLGVPAKDAVFVDDVSENVAAAQKVGMAGIHFRAGMDMRVALSQVGVS